MPIEFTAAVTCCFAPSPIATPTPTNDAEHRQDSAHLVARQPTGRNAETFHQVHLAFSLTFGFCSSGIVTCVLLISVRNFGECPGCAGFTGQQRIRLRDRHSLFVDCLPKSVI